jgi:CheY-like chemotaxis protein
LPIKLRIVANGFEGLLQVGQQVPDILIADLMMPGMDGFEMIRNLRANPNLARMDIIVVSAIDREEIAKARFAVGHHPVGQADPFPRNQGLPARSRRGPPTTPLAANLQHYHGRH